MKVRLVFSGRWMVFVWVVAACLGIASRASAENELARVGLQQAVDIAIANQPQILTGKAQLKVAQAKVLESRGALLPQLSGTAAYTRSTANYVMRPGSLPSTLATIANNRSTNHSYNYFNFGLSAEQLIYDFGQSWDSWKSLKDKVVAQDANLRATQASVVLNVRTAFFSAREKKELLQVAVDTLSNQKLHVEQTQGFVAVGTQPDIALAQAKTDFANARVSLINAENDYAVAKASLNQTMGVEWDTDYDVADDDLDASVYENAALRTLLEQAWQRRPELRSAQALIVAQQKAIRGLKGSYGPSLSATGQVTEAGTVIQEMGWNWSVGLSLSWPLFAGGTSYHTIAENEATLTSLLAQQNLQRQQIRLDLEKARLSLRAARASLEAAEDTLVNARQQLALAEGRYQTGVGGMIELSDAQLKATSAASQRAQARFSLAQARASFAYALGLTDADAGADVAR